MHSKAFDKIPERHCHPSRNLWQHVPPGAPVADWLMHPEKGISIHKNEHQGAWVWCLHQDLPTTWTGRREGGGLNRSLSNLG